MSPQPQTRVAFLLTCEHAGNRIPAEFAPQFARARSHLTSHRGYDPGALALAQHLARKLRAPLIAGRYSRLLIELNRSLHHPALWSDFTRGLDPSQKQRVIDRIYRRHRETITRQLDHLLARNRIVIHVGVHTFTPVRRGVRRNVDIGLLYDPQRPLEKTWALLWQPQIEAARPGWKVRRNQPYRGVADGLTTALRRGYPPDRYVGIELEVNQALTRRSPQSWQQTQDLLAQTLTATRLQATTRLADRTTRGPRS